MAGYEFEQADAQAEAVRISGRVKWFDAGKGYGFIVPDDPSQTDLKDVLLHVTSLRSSGREHALEGSIITCDVVRRPKGWQVAEVVELDESAAPAGRRSAAPRDGGCRRDREAFLRGDFANRPPPRRAAAGRRAAGAGQGEVVQPHQGLRLRGARRRAGRHLRPHRDPAPLAAWKTCSRATTSWCASPRAPRAWWSPRSRSPELD